jgi:hypothetical protein
MKAFTFAASRSLLQLGCIAGIILWQVVPVVPAPSDDYYCGEDWDDAHFTCEQPCPGGTNAECVQGQTCFAGTGCSGPTQSPVAPTEPTATPYSVSAQGDNRMVAFLGNWQSCPTPEQYEKYTHIVISFAVSYAFNAAENQCSTSCTIGDPVPICNNQENQGLMDAWHADGKKVILSFGGAGMVSTMLDALLFLKTC